MHNITLQDFDNHGVIYYSAPEIARAFDVSEATVKAYCRKGKINALKLCWHILPSGTHLYKYIFTLDEARKFWTEIKKPVPNTENQPRFIELTDDGQVFYFHNENFSQREGIFRNYKNYFGGRCALPDWPELRRKVFTRDKFTCQICGSAKNLVAHHVSYDNVNTPSEFDDLITLCSGCHRKIHAKDIAEKRILFHSRNSGQDTIEAIHELTEELIS